VFSTWWTSHQCSILIEQNPVKYAGVNIQRDPKNFYLYECVTTTRTMRESELQSQE
jgi:hypothetical protein